MRFSPSNLLRRGRAVNAVTRFVQADPRDANGIVRPRWQHQLVANGLQLSRLGKKLRIDRVIWVRRVGDDMQFPGRPLVETCCNAARKMREQIGILVERLQEFFAEMNDGKRRLVRRRGIIHVGNVHNHVGGGVGPVDARIELPDQFGMRVALFGDEFELGFVIQRGLL